MIECDVLVVGAGPAGSSAAWAAANVGAKTILIDKKEQVGVPVQCAESISKFLTHLLPYEIPREFFIWETEGISFWAENLTIERRGDFWSAYALNRENVDNWIARMAVKEGARISLKTQLIRLQVGGDYNIKKAFLKKDNNEKEIIPKIVIAADGVDSTVIENLGLSLNKEKNIGNILSYELKNVKNLKPTMDQLFIGDFAPGTYGYIFPKSRDTANVGVGTLFSEEELIEKYNDFLELPEVKKQLKNSEITKNKSGRVPYRSLTSEWVYGNVMLVGDAAAQNIKPFVEGYVPGIICGWIAGKLSRTILKNRNLIYTYKEIVSDTLGQFFDQSEKLSEVMYELGSLKGKKQHLLRLGLSANIFKAEEVENLIKEEEKEISNLLEKGSGR